MSIHVCETMGAVLSVCVKCCTDCHDQHQEWKSKRQDRNNRLHGLDNSSYNGDVYAAAFKRQPTSTIFVAIQDQSSAEVLRHLRENESCKTELNSNEETPLHLACRLGYPVMVKVLLDNGCRGDIVTKHGSPMHCLLKAVKCSYLSGSEGTELLRRLLNSGCDQDSLDDKGQSVLYQAVNLSNRAWVDILLSGDVRIDSTEPVNGFTPLHMAVFKGDIGCLVSLLHVSSIPLNCQDNQGRSPLVIALLNLLEWVQHEPFPNQMYSAQATIVEPVQLDRYRKVAIVEALLIAGADPNLIDSHSRNPMIIAHGLLALEMLRYSSAMGYTSNNSDNQSNNSSPRRVQESLFAPMVRLLVMCGGRFPKGHQQTSFMRCADWMQKLYEDSLGPPPLESSNNVFSPEKLIHLCRLAIRGHLGKVSQLHALGELPLPEKLLRYVQIKYI